MKLTVIAGGFAAGAGIALATAGAALAGTGDESVLPQNDPLGFLFNAGSPATGVLNNDWSDVVQGYAPSNPAANGDWAGLNLSDLGDNANPADKIAQSGDVANFANYDDQLFDKVLAGSPATDGHWFDQGLGQLVPDLQAWDTALGTDLLGALDGKISLTDLGTDLFGTKDGLFTEGITDLFGNGGLGSSLFTDTAGGATDLSGLDTALSTFGTALLDPADWSSLGQDFSAVTTDLTGMF